MEKRDFGAGGGSFVFTLVGEDIGLLSATTMGMSRLPPVGAFSPAIFLRWIGL